MRLTFQSTVVPSWSGQAIQLDFPIPEDERTAVFQNISNRSPADRQR